MSAVAAKAGWSVAFLLEALAKRGAGFRGRGARSMIPPPWCK